MDIINLKEISNKYGMSITFWRTVLCRPVFNKFLYRKNEFYNCAEFDENIMDILIKKSKENRTRWKFYKYSPTG